MTPLPNELPASTTDRRAFWMAAGILALLVFIAFSPFLKAELFWDDRLVIRADGPITQWSTIPASFSERCILFGSEFNYPYYRPVIDSLFVVEYHLLYTHPFVYHLTNFLLHLGSAVLTLALFWRLAPDGARPWAPLLGAGLFALHPLQVESVLWPAARPAVLCGTLCLGSLHLLLRIQRNAMEGRRWWPAAVVTVLLYGTGMLSKEVAVTLIPVALPVLLFSMVRPARAVWGTLLVMMAATALYLWGYFHFLGGETLPVDGGGRAGALAGRAALAMNLQGFYLRQLLWPAGLNPYYTPGMQSTPVNALLGAMALLLGALLMLAALLRRTAPWLLVACGLLLYFGQGLLPPMAGQRTAADRYLYQSLWGLGLIVVVLVPSVLSRIRKTRMRWVATMAMLTVLAAVSLRTALPWLTEYSLWYRVLEKDPTSPKATMYLADIYGKAGNYDRAVELLELGITAPRKVFLRDSFDGAFELGKLAFDHGDYPRASSAFRTAAEFPPLEFRSRVAEAIVLHSMGDRDGAVALLRSLQEPPVVDAGAFFNLVKLGMELLEDREWTAPWYRRLRESGAPPMPEVEAWLSGDGE